MKKISLIIFVALVITIATVINAMAFSLPAYTDIQFKFNNWDSLLALPLPNDKIGVKNPYGNNEFSWGILNISTIQDPSGDPAYWTVGQNGERLTGMFHDLKLGLATLSATGNLDLYLYDGLLDVYLDDADLAGYTQANAKLGKNGRIDSSHYTNFTDSNVSLNPFLSVAFTPGIVPIATDPLMLIGLGKQTSFLITLNGNSVLNTAGGDSFGNVIGGDYASLFNSNTFLGGNADFKFGFHGNGPSRVDYNSGVIHFDADTWDPADGFTTPEPGSLSLLGIGLLGILAKLRRKKVTA